MVWKCCCAMLSPSVMSDSRTIGLYSLPNSSVHGDCLSKTIRVGCHALLHVVIFPTQGFKPRSPTFQDFLPSEPPETKNTGVVAALFPEDLLTQE